MDLDNKATKQSFRYGFAIVGMLGGAATYVLNMGVKGATMLQDAIATQGDIGQAAAFFVVSAAVAFAVGGGAVVGAGVGEITRRARLLVPGMGR